MQFEIKNTFRHQMLCFFLKDLTTVLFAAVSMNGLNFRGRMNLRHCIPTLASVRDRDAIPVSKHNEQVNGWSRLAWWNTSDAEETEMT